MFFIFGISTATKQIPFQQTIICKRCGQFGQIHLFVTYTYFSLFFIPVFKWSKKYYARTSCCNALYSIDTKTGKEIERGTSVSLTEQDLYTVENEENTSNYSCKNCGYPLDYDFVYCPKCGEKLH